MRYTISELDVKVNKEKVICFDKAMNAVRRYIVKKIDPTFPNEEFREWYENGAEKPFKWNKNTYSWS